MFYDPMNRMNRRIAEQIKRKQEMADSISEKHKRTEEREEEQIQLLREMNQSLINVSSLVRKNNEINTEAFELFQEMNTMLIAKDKEEAEGIFQKVIQKASSTKETIETTEALVKYGKYLLLLLL